MRTNTGQILYIPRVGQRANLQHPLMKGCVGWWPLTDGAGGIAKDITANAYDATGTGIQWEQSVAGTRYDAAGGHLETSSFPVTNVSAFSYSLWLQNDSISSDYFGRWSGLGGQKAILFRSNIGQFYVRNEANTLEQGFSAGVNINTEALNSWNGMAHVVFTLNNGTATAYVNGTQRYQDTSFMAGPYIPASTTNGVAIGNGHGTPMTTGAIQNVRLWEREISSTEVMELYHRPWSGLETTSSTRYFFLSSPLPTINPFSRIITSSTILNKSGKTVIRRGA